MLKYMLSSGNEGLFSTILQYFEISPSLINMVLVSINSEILSSVFHAYKVLSKFSNLDRI